MGVAGPAKTAAVSTPGMTALTIEPGGRWEQDQVPVPEPGPGQVLVRTGRSR